MRYRRAQLIPYTVLNPHPEMQRQVAGALGYAPDPKGAHAAVLVLVPDEDALSALRAHHTTLVRIPTLVLGPNNARLAALALRHGAMDYLPEPVTGASLSERMRTLCEVSRLPYNEAKRNFDWSYVAGLLRCTRGNMSEAAKISGKDRKNFYSMCKRLGITADQFR